MKSKIFLPGEDRHWFNGLFSRTRWFKLAPEIAKLSSI